MKPLTPIEYAITQLANAIETLAMSGEAVFGTRAVKAAIEHCREAYKAIEEAQG